MAQQYMHRTQLISREAQATVLDSLGSRSDQPAWGDKGEFRWRAADSCVAGDAEHAALNPDGTRQFAAPPFGGRAKRGLDLFLALLLLPVGAIVALPVALLIAL